MNFDTEKNTKKIIGSIIKSNRIKQNISQKGLSKGICVPSYLSRIESGELVPSEDVLSIIFDRLGFKFNDSIEFINDGKKDIEMFFNKLNFNEFDYTNKMFEKIESKESQFITSPLIIEYYLAKLARYSCTPNREKFSSTQTMLLNSFDLLSSKQKYIYNFYVGIDLLVISQDIVLGKDYILKALSHKETGHCYFWISYVYRLENNPIKAYDSIKKSLDFYLNEGNILSIMDSYEKLAEVYFMLDNYSDAISYLEMALNMAMKMSNKYFIEHINSILAWTYYRLKDYDTALDYLNYNTGLIDHRMVIPDSIVESLIYFAIDNTVSLKNSIGKIRNVVSLEHISENLANTIYDLFEFYIKTPNAIKYDKWEKLLLEIINNSTKLVELKKVFTSILKDHYIVNRRYKDALYL